MMKSNVFGFGERLNPRNYKNESDKYNTILVCIKQITKVSKDTNLLIS